MNFEPIVNTGVKLSFIVCSLAIAAAAAVFMQPTHATVQMQRESAPISGYIATDGCLVLQIDNTPVWALCNDNTHAPTEN